MQIDPGWRKSIRIVEGAGTYQSQGNYAQDVNPIYDYVAEQFDALARASNQREHSEGMDSPRPTPLGR